MGKRVSKADAQVGARAKAFRLKAGLSQGQVGKVLGVTFQQIQKYENGTNRISASMLDKMAKLYKVPIGAFFNNNNNHKNHDDEAIADISLISTRGRARLMNILDQINDPRYDTKLADMAEFHLDNKRK
jgi:transcriptional regulator with XRE-family HTH domain